MAGLGFKKNDGVSPFSMGNNGSPNKEARRKKSVCVLAGGEMESADEKVVCLLRNTSLD